MYVGTVFGSFEDFNTVADRCTQNYECMVLDNTIASSSPMDCIRWYKATINVDPFQLGSPSLYTLEKNNQRSSDHCIIEDDIGGKGLVVSKEGDENDER